LEEDIHSNFFGGKKETSERELLIERRRIMRHELTKHTWKSSYWKAAKERLLIETKGKCAYCEAPTNHVAYGDVEHYRPKSVYWWLAYCYDNYLVSCTLCNQKFKGARFPIKNAKMRGPIIRQSTTDAYIGSKAGTIAPDPLISVQVKQFQKLHDQERPLLLNPYYDEPSKYFAWRADVIKKEVELIPLPGNADAETFCQAAIKYYGLNRKELLDYRWWEYEKFWTYRLYLEEPGLSAVLKNRTRTIIEKMKMPQAPYAGMIRYFNNLPFDELPVPPE
jgi:hypothetical protein